MPLVWRPQVFATGLHEKSEAECATAGLYWSLGLRWPRIVAPCSQRRFATICASPLRTSARRSGSWGCSEATTSGRPMGFRGSYGLESIGQRRARIRLLGNGVAPIVMRTVVKSLSRQGDGGRVDTQGQQGGLMRVLA